MLFHLILAGLGATLIQFPPDSSFGKFFATYGRLTGASQGYNYFAPEIGSELRARFEIKSNDGTVREEFLVPGATREAQLHLSSVVGELGEAVSEQKARQSVTAVWAAKVFQRHPEAKTVTVVVESFRLPSLIDYAQGERTGWDLFYRGTFARKGAL